MFFCQFIAAGRDSGSDFWVPDLASVLGRFCFIFLCFSSMASDQVDIPQLFFSLFIVV